MKSLARFLIVFTATFALLSTPAGAATQQKANTKNSKAAPAKKTSKSAPAKSYTIAQNPYRGAIAIDAVTGKVLIDNGGSVKGYPASVLKLMDLLIVIEKIKRGEISLQDQVPVSAKAAQTGGSQVWLAHKESFTLEDMLYALMIRSANDVAVAIAEKVAGSTDAFVDLMNRRAKELGMVNTTFRSVHGLPPAAGQQHDETTARDITLLCRELLKHPETLKYTSARQRPFRPNGGNKMVMMRTHNHLLANLDGCDGLKTGFTARAGYSIAVTAARNGRRIIVVVLGSPDYKTRDAKAAELANKAFALLQPAASPKPRVPASAVR